MSPSLKAALALVFVVVLGAVLVQPILNSAEVSRVAASEDQDPPPRRPKPSKASATPEPAPSPEPSPEPSPTQEGGLISGPFRTQPLFDRYPRSCLRSADDGDRLIATLDGDRVAFGTTAGPTDPGGRGGTSPGKVKRLLGLNRTADLYAVRGTSGGILLAPPEGAADGKLPFGKITGHTWSPVSPCSLAISKNGSLLVPQSRGPSRLVRDGVESAAFSPDGRSMAVVIEEGKTTSVWVARLEGTNMREVQRERSGPRITLESWSPDGRTLYLSVAGNSGVSFVTRLGASGPPSSGRVGGGRVTNFEQCGDRLLGLLKGGIATISARGPNYLTDQNAGYTAVSCAPNGGFLAAIRNGNLVLLDRNGREIRDLTTDSGFRDIYVDWGDGGAGVLFGRVPSGGGRGQVWHIAEGAVARNTGVTFTPGPGAIDWSASPPTGLPLR